MKKILVLAMMLFAFCAHAQFRNNIWCFGDSAGIDFLNPNNPVTFNSGINTRGSAVSIADSLGNLLFYANTRANVNGKTTYVYNKQNQLMANGTQIAGEGWYKELVIVPMPDHPNLFYLFTCQEAGTAPVGFYYSIIDLSLNGGLGAVTQKNIQLLSFQPCDGLTAIKHGNGRDWWVLIKQWDPNTSNGFDEFYSFLVTPDSVTGPFIQHVSPAINSGFLRIEPSQDGSKLMVEELGGLLELFDFDRCTGLLSNKIPIEPHRPNWPNYFSCKLSPNKSKLYVTSSSLGVNFDISYLFQYDLTAPNISATRDTLATFVLPIEIGILELAPDNKIYLGIAYQAVGYPYPDSARNYINENLSVINYPDSLGAACDFQPFSFYLGGKRTYYGLPNNPNYELPALGGSICDTLGLPNSISNEQEKNYFSLSPNPFSNQLTFHFSAQQNSKALLKIFNSIGGGGYSKKK